MNGFKPVINRFVHLSLYQKRPEILNFIKSVLKVSEGFPSHWEKARAHLNKKGELVTGKTGHPRSSHLSSDVPLGKTAFASEEEMAESLRQTLNSAEGQKLLRDAYGQPDMRFRCDSKVDLVKIIATSKESKKTISVAEQQAAQKIATECHLEAEVRVRNGLKYFHVQTFYPKWP
jgi:hypothetical protein